MTNKGLERIAAASVLIIVCASYASGDQQFPTDPLKDQTGEHVTGEFMELRDTALGLDNFHTGLDTAVSSGGSVYPPIKAGVTCTVSNLSFSGHWVVLSAPSTQGAQYAFYLAGHITPAVQLNDVINRNTPIGTLQSGAHLHSEIWLSDDPSSNQRESVNPRDEALESVDWMTDTVYPTVVGYAIHQSGEEFTWEIHAHDQVDADTTVYNGIYSMTLYINEIPTRSFTFDKLHGTVADFYYCTDCYPNGTNDLQYKFVWTRPYIHEFKWRLKYEDGMGNTVDGIPMDGGTIAPFGEMSAEVRDGSIRLQWSYLAGDDVIYFDVLEGPSRDDLKRVNGGPIIAKAEESEYEFGTALPDVWESVWYRIVAWTVTGEARTVAEQSFDVPRSHLKELRVLPNPFTESCAILLNLAREELVMMEVIDCGGRRVARVHEGRLRRGIARLAWDGRDGSGRRAAAGVYFLRTEIGGALRPVKKLVRIEEGGGPQ